MKTLVIFKDSLLSEGRDLQWKMGYILESLSFESLNSIRRYRINMQNLQPGAVYEEYRQWLSRVIECDSLEEIRGVHFPRPGSHGNLDALGKAHSEIGEVLHLLEASDRHFLIYDRGSSVAVCDEGGSGICSFTGEKMVKFLRALKGSKLNTQALNGLLGYAANNKYSVADLRKKINEKFRKDSSVQADLVESGKRGQGYKINIRFSFPQE